MKTLKNKEISEKKKALAKKFAEEIVNQNPEYVEKIYWMMKGIEIARENAKVS